MKTTCMLSLPFVFSAAVVAQADTSAVQIPNLTFAHRTNLIDTDQSQTFETLSVADEFTRLPSSAYKIAKVHFLTNDGGMTFSASDTTSFTDTTINKCKTLGYTKTSCSSGNPTNICPYNSSYFKTCCDAKYKYSPSQCQYPYSPGTVSCGGKYECVCDKSLFPVVASSCTSPMMPSLVSGNSCVENGVTYVSECVCPSNYTETCSGNNLQGKGVGCSKNGVTKYTDCKCKSGYTLTCSQNGASPSNPSDYCLNDGVKYYNNCKTCPNNCSLDSCPNGVVCEQEACSGKFCDVGCAIDKGYQDLDNYWCDGALRCLVKCP